MTGPLISIVVPSFNQGQYIEETIRSVLEQSYTNVELIVIDGGSTDDTVNVIRRYESRIKYWVSEKDEGQTHAIVKGLAQCTGELFNWINSDDKLAEGALEKIADAYVKNERPDLIAGNIIMFDANGKRKLHPRINHHGNLPKTLGFGQMCQPGMFYKTEIVRTTGLNTAFHYSMDVELFFRFNMMLWSPKMLLIDETLAEFRLHESSKTISEGSTAAGSKFFAERTGLFEQYAASFNDSEVLHKLKTLGYGGKQSPEKLKIDERNHPLFRDAVNYFIAQQLIEAIHVFDKKKIRNHFFALRWLGLDRELRARMRRLLFGQLTVKFRRK